MAARLLRVGGAARRSLGPLSHACTVSDVAVHRRGEVSVSALGLVPKLYNLGSNPSDQKFRKEPIKNNKYKRSECKHSMHSKSQPKPISTAFLCILRASDAAATEASTACSHKKIAASAGYSRNWENNDAQVLAAPALAALFFKNLCLGQCAPPDQRHRQTAGKAKLVLATAAFPCCSWARPAA